METKIKQSWMLLKCKGHEYFQRMKLRWLIHWYRLWRSRSGSIFGIGYIVAFLYLEVNNLVEEIVGFDFSVAGLIGKIILQILGFAIDTIINSLMAFLWPFLILSGELPVLISLIILILIVARHHWQLTKVSIVKGVDQQQVDRVIDIFFEEQLYEETLENESKDNHNSKKKNKARQVNHYFKKNIDSKAIENLHQLAENAHGKKLDIWRLQPDSTLALVLLLHHFPQLQPIKTANKLPYIFEVIKEAINAKLDKELSPVQRAVLYIPYIQSGNERLEKKGKSAVNKLRKQYPEEIEQLKIELQIINQ